MSNDTIYVMVGRSCGKTIALARELEEICKSGKKVVLVEPKYSSRHIEGKRPIDLYVDRGILTPERMERAEQMLRMLLKGESNA